MRHSTAAISRFRRLRRLLGAAAVTILSAGLSPVMSAHAAQPNTVAGIPSATVAKHGEQIAKPVCPAGQSPIGTASLQRMDGAAILGAQASLVDDLRDAWLVRIASLTPDGWRFPDAASQATALVISRCDQAHAAIGPAKSGANPDQIRQELATALAKLTMINHEHFAQARVLVEELQEARVRSVLQKAALEAERSGQRDSNVTARADTVFVSFRIVAVESDEIPLPLGAGANLIQGSDPDAIVRKLTADGRGKLVAGGNMAVGSGRTERISVGVIPDAPATTTSGTVSSNTTSGRDQFRGLRGSVVPEVVRTGTAPASVTLDYDFNWEQFGRDNQIESHSVSSTVSLTSGDTLAQIRWHAGTNTVLLLQAQARTAKGDPS